MKSEDEDRKRRRRILYAILAAAAIITAISSLAQAGTNRPFRYYTDSGNTAFTYITNGSDNNTSFWGINTDSPKCELDINGTICINGSPNTRQGVFINGSPLSGGGGSGTVTQVNTGNGLTGGPITVSGTISVNATTCSATDATRWNGTAWLCMTPSGGGGGNSTVEMRDAVNNTGIYNISISCSNITGGSDGDYCSDASNTYSNGSGILLSGGVFSFYCLTSGAGNYTYWNGTTCLTRADQDTTYSAGSGLLLTSTTFSVNWPAGNDTHTHNWNNITSKPTLLNVNYTANFTCTGTNFLQSAAFNLDGTQNTTQCGTPTAGSSGNNNNGSGILTSFITEVNNSGTTQTTLFSYSVPGNTSISDGDVIKFDFAGITNGCTATVSCDFSLYVNGTKVFDSSAVVLSADQQWSVWGIVQRTGANTAKSSVRLQSSGAMTWNYNNETTLTNTDWTSGVLINLTGTASGVGAGSNQISAKQGYIKKDGATASGNVTGSKMNATSGLYVQQLSATDLRAGNISETSTINFLNNLAFLNATQVRCALGMQYEIYFAHGSFNPQDSITTYHPHQQGSNINNVGNLTIGIPVGGNWTLVKVYQRTGISSGTSVLGSSELVNFSIMLNQTVSGTQWQQAMNLTYQNITSNQNINFTYGDILQVRMQSPVYATNPVAVNLGWTFVFTDQC